LVIIYTYSMIKFKMNFQLKENSSVYISQGSNQKQCENETQLADPGNKLCNSIDMFLSIRRNTI